MHVNQLEAPLLLDIPLPLRSQRALAQDLKVSTHSPSLCHFELLQSKEAGLFKQQQPVRERPTHNCYRTPIATPSA